MIRKINFTGRKRIKRSNVRVDVLRDPRAARVFNILMDLSDMGLDPQARVYVEAYHRTGYQRYDFGSVGQRKIPEDRRLSRFSDATVPLFRVKVVDRRSAHGRSSHRSTRSGLKASTACRPEAMPSSLSNTRPRFLKAPPAGQ